MAILFVGTSLADMAEMADAPAAWTTSADIDTFVLEGIRLPNGGDHSIGITFPADDEIWLSFYMRWTATSGSAKPGIQFKSGTTELFNFNGQGNSGIGALSYHNGTSMQIAVVTGGDYNGLHRVDINIKMADTGGVFKVYRDGVLDLDLTSITEDTIRTAATTLNRITINTFSLSNTVYSSIILANEDTRGMRLTQQLPTGAGATSQWGGTYASIDETGINDTDSISTSVIGDVSTFSFPAIPTDFNSSAWVVKAVAAGLRATATPEGDIDVAGVVRTASTNYETAALDIPPSYIGKQAIWEVNPNTTAAWTYSDASGAQIGVKAVA